MGQLGIFVEKCRFFGNAHFSSRKSKGTGTVLLAREQAHSLLFKTPGLFDNGQLLMILEGFFDMSL